MNCLLRSSTIVTSGNERETEMNAMQCIFTGPPRVGKSSFWQRVLGIIPERLMASTDITSSEGSVRINIRGTCGFAVHVSELEWRKLLVEEEMEGFVALVTQQGDALYQKLFEETHVGETQVENDPGTQLTNTVSPQQTLSTEKATPKQAQPDISIKSDVPSASVVSSNKSETISSSSSTSPLGEDEESLIERGRMATGEQNMSTPLPSPSQVLEQALITMRQAEVTKNVDSATFVYFTDTGGQLEFQEALSLLMAGCNTVLIVFNLEHDLHSSPPLEYLPSLDEPPIQYDSPYTVGEMLCQSLMSVPIGEGKEEDEEGTDREAQNQACVLFIGTHRDTVSPQRIEEMNRNLLELIRDTPQYQAHVVKQHSAGNIIFAVDNFSSLQNDEDFVPIRRTIQSLIYGNSCFRVKARTSWLFMGIVFQKLSDSRPIISLDQCLKIAQQCGIRGQDIDMALKFLHRTLGAIRYYHTESLHNVVILKPQLIINLLSQFMRRAFKKLPSHRAAFDGRDIQEVVKDCKFMNEHLMLNLIHDLLLSAPHPDTTIQHPRYYLTCMLPVEKAAQEENDPTALLLTLKGYVLPTGIGRATVTSILQKQTQSDTSWKINYHSLFRNSLEFTAGPSNTMFKVKCTKRHLSISVMSDTRQNTSTYLKVRKYIEAVMTNVLQLYCFGESSAPITGFLCSSVHDDVRTAPHVATITPEGSLQCSATRTEVGMPQKLQHWFMVRILRQRSSVATGAYLNALTILLRVRMRSNVKAYWAPSLDSFLQLTSFKTGRELR